jgi:hypothetical protein
MKRSRQSYPLSFIFLTVFIAALLAVAISSLGPSIRNRTWDYTLLPASAICCGLLAAFIGGIAGMHGFDRPKRAAGGASLGLLIGLLIGPMLLVNSQGIEKLYVTQIGGTIGLLAFALYSTLSVKDHMWEPEPEPDFEEETHQSAP